MSKHFKVIFIILIILNFFFASWYVLHQDINFSADIGRDFLLFQEIDQKKIVLIGPRSSASGLFHGPLWLYVNYPAYLLGDGNPVVVGWGWVFFIICFTIGCFFAAKKLFNEQAGYFFALMVSTYMVFHAHSLINPHGTLFMLPFFFLFFILYFKTKKLIYLLMHAFIGGLMVQFEMAVGIPFLILSFFAVLGKIILIKKPLHILAFVLSLVPLINFVVFDLRHNFLITQGVIKYLTSYSGSNEISIFSLLWDRFSLLMSGVEIIRTDPGYRNLMLFIVTLLFMVFQIKHKKYKLIYFSFLYFYGGFLLLSLVNKGPILYFYFYPLFPLVFLIFSSFITSHYKKIFIPIFFLVYVMNVQSIFMYTINESRNVIGKNTESWKFLRDMTKELFNGPEREFGYFVYTPDSFAYAPKYAMFYAEKFAKKKAYSFEKKPVTYLIAEPPPRDNPYMQSQWWVKNKARIDKKPKFLKSFPNGYKIEKYLLAKEDIEVPIADGTDLGIHFR